MSHSALPAIRATTHVDGKAIGSSRRARRGRRLLVEDDHGAFGGTPISSSPNCVAGDVGGPSSCDRPRMPGWTSRWGRGRLGHIQDDQETFDRGCRSCARFACGCGRCHAPGRRARVSSKASVPTAQRALSLVHECGRPLFGDAPTRRRIAACGRGRHRRARRCPELRRRACPQKSRRLADATAGAKRVRDVTACPGKGIPGHAHCPEASQ